MVAFRLIGIVFIVLIASKSNAQSKTFAKLYSLKPIPAANFNAVLVTDTAYFMVGVVSDSLPLYGPKPVFVRTDTEGNIEVVKMYKDGNKNYETWHAGMYFDTSGKIVTNGYIFNNPNKYENFFIRYLQNGEVDTIVEFDYSLSNTDVSYPMLALKNGNYIVPVNSNPNLFSRNVLHFLNQNGEVVKSQTYNNNLGNFIILRTDTTQNGFIIGGWKAPLVPMLNGINQTVIIKFDSSGNKILEYESPVDEDWCGTLGGIIANDKDETIYVSGQGYIFDPNSVSDYFHYKWYATKMDKDKNIVWRTELSSLTEAAAEETRFWNIYKLKDKKNFITMGMVSDSTTGIYAWLVKFSDDGEIIWNRNYKFESDTSGYLHEIRDLAEDSYGNLIAVGERLDLVRQGINTQQALMMKLDKYGCLIPGCHIVSTNNKEADDFNINIYPNPATDFVSFYLDEHIAAQINGYCIRDIAGNIVKGNTSLENNINYVVHTNDFPSGIYFMLFLKDEQIVKIQKFIVLH